MSYMQSWTQKRGGMIHPPQTKEYCVAVALHLFPLRYSWCILFSVNGYIYMEPDILLIISLKAQIE